MEAQTLTSSSEFAEAMSALASGVVMVTSRLDGRPWGVTVSAFASVSAEPPTILVSLRSDGAASRAIDETDRFGVSILGAQNRAAARHGSSRRTPKFLERYVDQSGHDLSPAIAGALAHLDCEVAERVVVADHTIFIGSVRSVRVGRSSEPLVYFRRSYRALDPQPSIERRSHCLTS